MGVFKTADGRTLVGIGQQDGNEYSGFNGWRDCVIQLTATGATENSVKYLNAIKDYAIAHNAKGESIMPPNLSIWISNNGATTAVQADDIAVDGANVTICGIKWNGTAWDYTDAGSGGSGGASSLDDLSDVIISNPTLSQVLMYTSDGVSGSFRNKRLELGQLRNVSITGKERGKALLCLEPGGAGDYSFDFPQCAESITFVDSVTQTFEQVISMLKVSAKSSGKAGAKLSVPNAAAIVSSYDSIADTHKRVPICDLGSYVFYPKGRIAASKMMFSSADTDADGVYDIIFVTDGANASTYIAVEYTPCPAMS